MPELIKVGMADYKVGRAPDTLISYGLGSCIGISLYDPQTKIGGLLHIMLPELVYTILITVFLYFIIL